MKRFWRWLRVPAVASTALVMPPPMPGVVPTSTGREMLRHWQKVRQGIRRIVEEKEAQPILRARSYTIPEPMPGVLPEGHDKRGPLALDSAISATYSFASQARWFGGGFMGYPLLAELTQIPEFRSPCAQLANDMTRQWGRVVSTSQDGDKKQIAEKIKAIEDELKRLNAQEAFRWAFEQDNQFGRSQIFINVGEIDGPELTKPLDPRIKIKKGGLKAITPVETYWTYPNRYETINPLKPNFYRPDSWFANGIEIHSTRLLIFNSRPLSDILKPAYLFGGISLIQLMWVCVENWIRTRQSVSDLINAFSIMVLQTDLAQAMSAEGADLLLERAAVFNDMRSNMGLMVTGHANEDFKNVSAALGSLDKLQAQSQEHQAAVALIPLVVMFGITPTGLNVSSESELQIYDGNIKSVQERVGSPNMKILLQCVQMSLFEEIDDSIDFAWNPLRQLTGKEQAELRKADAEMYGALVDRGIVDPLEVRTVLAAEQDGLWSSLNVDDVPEQPDPEVEGDPMHEPDGDPEAPEGEHGIHGGGDDTLSKISLNGAQVTSMLEVIEKVGTGELPIEAALNILTTAFPIDMAHARKLMSGIKPGSNKPEPKPVSSSTATEPETRKAA